MNHCFIVDKSLGTLTKWLRILGCDTISEQEVSPQDFCDRIEGGGILITRSKKLQKRWANHHHVFTTSNLLDEQLKQVVDQIGIRSDDIRPFSRCVHCNFPIDEVDKNEVYGLVPDYVWETHDSFNQCSQCKRIYWSGSHAERSMEMIESIFGAE